MGPEVQRLPPFLNLLCGRSSSQRLQSRYTRAGLVRDARHRPVCPEDQQGLGCTHDVRLMPPAYVKPYVKRGKTDANDAEAICEAVTRPTMRFVPMKSPEQQAALALHRTRDLLVKQRTQLVNMIRGLLAEFGIEMARGLHHALELAKRVVDGRAPDVPELAQRVVTSLAQQIGNLQVQLAALEKELLAWHRSSDLSQRLATIPGVGIISATALAASVTEPERFRSGRQFAASLGLTPLQNSSGGKERMGGSHEWEIAICAGCWSSAGRPDGACIGGSTHPCDAAAPPGARRHCRRRQQNRARGMGNHDARRHLSKAEASCGVSC